MNRPKFEVVRNDDLIEVYVNGKCVDGGITESAAETARAVARALGADVVDTDEPSRQPYRYFLAFVGTSGVFQGTYNAFVEVPDPIEDRDTMYAALGRAVAAFAREGTRITNTAVTNFILVDGPC